MSKKILVDRMHAHSPQQSRAATERALDAILDSISETLASAEAVNIREFGSFTVAFRKAKKGRNPQTGKALNIPAHNVVRFSPGKLLQDAAEGAGKHGIEEWLDFRAFTRNMSAQLDELKEHLKGFRFSSAHPGEEKEPSETGERLKQNYSDARERLRELSQSSGEAWREMRKGMEKAMEQLGEAYRRAKDKF